MADDQKIRVFIVGCGHGGSAILDIFKDDPFIKVVGVTDMDKSAPGIRIAHKLNLPVAESYIEIPKREDVDIIINVTGSKEVGEDLRKIKSPKTELVDGLPARLMWQLVEERKKRYEERERILKEHETLYHLGLVIENIDSMKDAGHAIISYATKLTNTPAGSIAIFNEKIEDMELVASKGFSREFTNVERWELRKGGLTSHILNQKAPIAISDLSLYPNPNPLMVKEGVKAILAAPLTIEGRIIGVLYVDDFKKREFAAEEISLFSLLTIYAALTVERVKSIEEMRVLSITDGLTGLYNHRYLMEQLHKEVQRAIRYGRPLSIIMLDIDHFKDHNDEFGHLEGNRVLKSLAKILVKTARTTDTVCRFGGRSSV